MKIDTALHNNEKRHLYFIVDTILSRDLASAFWPLCVSYAPAYMVVNMRTFGDMMWSPADQYEFRAIESSQFACKKC